MKNRPFAYLFDIDGTLAHRIDRDPFDWSKVGEDEVDLVIREILLCLKVKRKIIIFTGRDGVCEKETKLWLKRHGIPYDHFDIRPEGNNEEDSVIKMRMYQKIQKDYHVIGVFDDRPRVLRMWRAIGLKTFDCGNGIEF